jgi:hypothetical protein
MIFAHANTFTRPKLCAALTHDDVAWICILTTIEFYTQPTSR